MSRADPPLQRRPERLRAVPADLSEPDRISYLAVARRAQAEGAHSYSVLSLGLQAYATAAKIKAETAPAPAPASVSVSTPPSERA